MLFKNDPFKHGFYEINGYRTFSKLEAIELQNRTGHWPYWNFNDEVFGQLDWTKEPNIDLNELYKVRARQIRDAYDYIVIFYSGGSDSVSVLSSFIDAGCKIDEVASIWNLAGSKTRDSYMNQEVDRVVLPSIRRLHDKGIEFKFRLIDYSEITSKFILSVDQDYNYYANNAFSPNNIVRAQFRERIKDYADIINSGKRLCFVWGSEKPQIFVEGNRHYIQFFDIIDNCVSPYVQQRYNQGWFDELFYWQPDLPEILIKQAHTLLKFTQTCNMPELYQEKFNKHGYNFNLKKYITDDVVKTIIYPSWDPTTFCNGKSPTSIFSLRDAWFWNGNVDEVNNLKSLSNRYFNVLGNNWIDNIKNKRKGIKCHCSPKYYLN